MAPSTINIAVVHAQADERHALSDYIADEVGFRVIGDTVPGPALLDLLRASVIHVLVLDLESFSAGTTDFISSARAASPATGILLLVRGQPGEWLDELMLRGAAGYVQAERIHSDLVAALRTIGMGRRYLPRLDPEPEPA
jgi:two-component system invasion response regulator UvrY